ncbi:cupin domain-containing protein [Muricoccus radiodurans]|uniref:cupin domain-containing protein n=1 Tax=Muricoccus radiodurans TaxID=2231721 RepID=UPI003CEC3A03
MDMPLNVSPSNHLSHPREGRTETVLGVGVLYKADAAATGGGLVCAELTVPPGAGIPPHRHSAEDESFYVLAGHVAISGDDIPGGEAVLGAGGFFHGPRGRVHGFRCAGEETAKLLLFVTPGAGIGGMFGDLAALGGDPAAMNPAGIVAVCARYGIEFTR